MIPEYLKRAIVEQIESLRQVKEWHKEEIKKIDLKIEEQENYLKVKKTE